MANPPMPDQGDLPPNATGDDQGPMGPEYYIYNLDDDDDDDEYGDDEYDDADDQPVDLPPEQHQMANPMDQLPIMSGSHSIGPEYYGANGEFRAGLATFAGQNGNRHLMDHEMHLMLLEQQNKREWRVPCSMRENCLRGQRVSRCNYLPLPRCRVSRSFFLCYRVLCSKQWLHYYVVM